MLMVTIRKKSYKKMATAVECTGKFPPPQEEQVWTDEEWRQWRREQWRAWDEDAESSAGEEIPWDELEVASVEVLPDEVLGWLLLRRANLSAASRLSVQASVGNSLKFRDLELALRDQEEELLQADQHRHSVKRRTFWVEEEGSWGLLSQPEENLEDLGAEIHWVGNHLPLEVYDPSYDDASMAEDDVYWSLDWDGWHGFCQDAQGFWLETDGAGNYWSPDEAFWNDLSPEEAKELEEAYSLYEAKARTFLQSRQFQKAKGKSRGFYPIQTGGKFGKSKGGKSKSKGKSKGKPSTTSFSSSSTSPTTFHSQMANDVMSATAWMPGRCYN